MKLGSIISILIISALFIIGIIALNNKVIEQKAGIHCYKEIVKFKNPATISKIELSNYSCNKINYMISNNLNIKSGTYPIAHIYQEYCEKSYSREYINKTHISTSYTNGSTHYSKEESADYYLENCLEDVNLGSDE